MIERAYCGTSTGKRPHGGLTLGDETCSLAVEPQGGDSSVACERLERAITLAECGFDALTKQVTPIVAPLPQEQNKDCAPSHGNTQMGRIIHGQADRLEALARRIDNLRAGISL